MAGIRSFSKLPRGKPAWPARQAHESLKGNNLLYFDAVPIAIGRVLNPLVGINNIIPNFWIVVLEWINNCK